MNKRLFIGIGALGLAALSTWLWWSRNSAPPVADPRLSTSLIWRNVHPGVKYLGDDVCAGCHAAVARSYREHPMGRSLSPVVSATPLERFDERAHFLARYQ